MSMDDHVPDNPLTYRLALAFDQYCAEREGNLSSQPLRRELVALYDEVSKALLLASADLIVRMPDENGEWGGEITSRWDDFLDRVDRWGFMDLLEQGAEIRIEAAIEGEVERVTQRLARRVKELIWTPRSMRWSAAVTRPAPSSRA